MEIRKILLITFMLLAVLAAGAVSAADEITSDNMTVADEATLDSVAVTDEATLDSVEGSDEIASDSVAVTEDDGVIVEDDKLTTKYDDEFYIAVNSEKKDKP